MDSVNEIRPVYGPVRTGDPPADEGEVCFIPRPFKGIDPQSLQVRGLTFCKEDLLDGPEQFRENGLVSSDRSMIILFCDLKSSTAALKALGSGFRNLQRNFFESCIKAVAETNKRRRAAAPSARYPRAIIDKFMGDGAMFYIDCGNTLSGGMEALGADAAEDALSIVHRIISLTQTLSSVSGMEAIAAKLHAARVEVGVRFGIAMGSGITLSVLGCSSADSDCAGQGDFTVTGEVVNLAARLEHATAAEFLSCIVDDANRIGQYTCRMNDSAQLRGTALGDAMMNADQHIVDLFAVCEQNYELRADSNFRHYLENRNDLEKRNEPEKAKKPIRLAWKAVPFSPRGFAGNHVAHLLGGNRSEELVRQV